MTESPRTPAIMRLRKLDDLRRVILATRCTRCRHPLEMHTVQLGCLGSLPIENGSLGCKCEGFDESGETDV